MTETLLKFVERGTGVNNILHWYTVAQSRCISLTDCKHAVQHVPDLRLDGGLEGPGEETDAGEDGGVQGARPLLDLTILLGQGLP